MIAAHTRAEAALERWEDATPTHALRAVSAARILGEAGHASDGALQGLLFSVKDLFPVAGVESCAGSLVLAGQVPVEESPLISALRSAGAVVFGKGVCAEFGFGVDTENRLDGRVLHPTDPSLSPGGSSGGDAVAVATAVVDFAIAGDYGGSIRWPAQAVGVLGLRFGVGRASVSDRIGAPRYGQQARLEVPGIMAREASVMRRVVDVLLRTPPARPTGRLVFPDPEALGTLAPPVAAAIDAAVGRALRAGYTVTDGGPHLGAALADAVEVYRRLRELTDNHEGVRALIEGHDDLLCHSTTAVLDAAGIAAMSADPAEIAALERRARQIARMVRAALSGTDGLLMPVAASGALGFGGTVAIDGESRDAVSLHAHLRAVSLTGLPALAVPVAEHVSVQLVGAAGSEHLLCDVAEAIAP